MPQNNEPIGCKIKALISHVFRQITKKDAHYRAWGEFMRGCGREIRITLAPKNVKVGKIRMNAEKREMQRAKGERFGGVQV
jgi:hypothetical protein